MQINFTGRGGLNVTEALRQKTTEKFAKIERHFDNIIDTRVTFDVEKLQQVAEATIHVPGASFHASHKTEDMYASMDGLVDKLDQQIKKFKEKLKDHHQGH